MYMIRSQVCFQLQKLCLCKCVDVCISVASQKVHSMLFT